MARVNNGMWPYKYLYRHTNLGRSVFSQLLKVRRTIQKETGTEKMRALLSFLFLPSLALALPRDRGPVQGDCPLYPTLGDVSTVSSDGKSPPAERNADRPLYPISGDNGATGSRELSPARGISDSHLYPTFPTSVGGGARSLSRAASDSQLYPTFPTSVGNGERSLTWGVSDSQLYPTSVRSGELSLTRGASDSPPYPTSVDSGEPSPSRGASDLPLYPTSGDKGPVRSDGNSSLARGDGDPPSNPTSGDEGVFDSDDASSNFTIYASHYSEPRTLCSSIPFHGLLKSKVASTRAARSPVGSQSTARAKPCTVWITVIPTATRLAI